MKANRLSFGSTGLRILTINIRINNMTKFSNSGLYKQPFYKKVSDLVYDQDFLLDTLCDNYEVFFKHYASEIEELGETKSQTINQITDLLLLKLYGERLYFDPLVFNPDIALECGLIPLTTPNIRINNNSLYRSCKDFINVLILPSGTFFKIWTERLYPKLDAYQALTDNSIDKESYLFKDPEHFEAVVGKSLMQKVVNAIS
jgi:hypothetical protein